MPSDDANIRQNIFERKVLTIKDLFTSWPIILCGMNDTVGKKSHPQTSFLKCSVVVKGVNVDCGH